jgi:hypothetical protein
MKTLTIFLTALITLPLSAEAAPKLLQKRIEKEARQAQRQAPAQLRLLQGQNCVDFSGRWEGSCRMAGETEAVSVTIEQEGCSSLKIEGEELQFGVNSVSATSLPDGIFASTNWSLGFSEDGQMALGNGLLSANVPQLVLPVGGRAIVAATREGNSLGLNGKLTVWLGQDDLLREAIECSLQKQ